MNGATAERYNFLQYDLTTECATHLRKLTLIDFLVWVGKQRSTNRQDCQRSYSFSGHRTITEHGFVLTDTHSKMGCRYTTGTLVNW